MRAGVIRGKHQFELAEVDLDLRGEGTIMNTAQKGRSDLKLASLRRDRELVGHARDVAFDIVDNDPLLESHEVLRDELRLVGANHVVQPFTVAGVEAANIALKWNEAGPIGLSALVASGLVLFAITLIVNMTARGIIARHAEFSEGAS